MTEEATEEPQDCGKTQSLPEAGPASVVDLEQWIIPAGEIDEGRAQGSETREMDAPSIEVSSVQTNFLQEAETQAESDNRKVREQPSLFLESLISDEPANQESKRKLTGYKFQAQLAFDFIESGLSPNEAQGAVSQVAAPCILFLAAIRRMVDCGLIF